MHHDTCLQRIRNALAKQHQEAQEFLQKMRERKLREMEAWKQRHARMREAQMQQVGYRSKNRPNAFASPKPRILCLRMTRGSGKLYVGEHAP